MKICLRRSRSAWLAVCLCSAVLCAAPCRAGGMVTLMVGGATEPTQLLNYGELLYNSAKQAESVANQIQAQLVRVQELQAAARNLANAPQAVLTQTVAPYQNQALQAQQLLDAVQAAQTTFQQAGQMVQARLAEAQALGTTPQQYLQFEAQLAHTRGGVYAAAYQRDTQTLQDVVTRSSALQNISDNLPSTGAVEGLDKLNALVSVVAGETLTLNRQVAAASAETHARQMNDSQQQQAGLAQAQQDIARQEAQIQAARQRLDAQNAMPSGYSQQQIEQNAWRNFGTAGGP